MGRLLPLRSGWSPIGDDADFYPADLPEDWRLTYFSNEFPAVLVPHDLWREFAMGAALDWAKDTSERFLFFLEDAGAESRPRALSIAQTLGGRFGGVVATDPWPTDIAVGRVFIIGDNAAGAARRTGEGMALRVPAELLGDSRAEAGWIAGQTGASGASGATGGGQDPCTIALLGDCDFATLERWVRLTELLGVA